MLLIYLFLFSETTIFYMSFIILYQIIKPLVYYRLENHKLRYYKKNLFIKLDIIITRTNNIKFSKRKITIKGIIRVFILIRIINFYIIPTNILFLLYL
jgi:hypothetical protein